MNLERIDCKKCGYFYITWEARFPNGCRLFRIKSKQIPSIVVYKSTGTRCENFVQKEKR